MQIHTDTLSDVARYIEREKKKDLTAQEPKFDALMRYFKRFRPIDSSLRMLEVGTGMGWVPIIAKQRGLNLRGLEISPMLVEAGKEYGRQYGVEPDIVLGNIEDYDIGESTYDIIIANSVFEHIEYWRPALKTMYTGLKPGGLLFFESTNKFSLKSGEYSPLPIYGWMPNRMRYKFRQKVHGEDIMKNGIDFHQFTYWTLRRAFRKTGFSEWYDRVDLVYPEDIEDAKKRAVLAACKSNALLKHLVLTFFEVTTFVCVK
jgi:2-polyprenyl-3-methyl-5-hydroxy-6-metoxy-1,4-benzoquinol methylase